MSLIFFIALRQLWSRRVLNGIAVAGVMVGVLVLITMSAIMQGFQMKFKGEILKISPHVTIFDKELNREGLSLGGLATPSPMVGSLDAMTPQALAGRWLAQKF